MQKPIVMIAAALFMGVTAIAGIPINQGIDRALFLDPFVESEVKHISDLIVLDAGCGMASIAEAVTQEGATLCGSDPEEEIGAQFNELAQAMKAGGRLMVAAPASYGILFTDGSQPDVIVQQHIDEVLTKIGVSGDPQVFTESCQHFNEVMRASFVRRGERLELVVNEKSYALVRLFGAKLQKELRCALTILKRSPLLAIKQAGLTCEEIKRPCFFGRVKYMLWRSSLPEDKTLGDAYLTNHPFTLYYVVKQG